MRDLGRAIDYVETRPDLDASRIAYFGTRTPFQERMRRDVPANDIGLLFDHLTRDVRPDDAEAFRLLDEGQTYVDLPMHLRRYRSDIFTDKYKRLAWNEVSRSITAHIAKDGYWYIHPQQHRTLSVREAAPGLPTWAALSSGHLGALLLPKGLQRLYIAIDRDPAGHRAAERLGARAIEAGIEARVLEPRLGDFNDDLRADGPEALRQHLAEQIGPEDRKRLEP